MIKQLKLTHFVLVEKAHIHFDSHFNIITGETGAGKTAIIEALSLALGARADTSLIRQGSDRALVEATFDISTLPAVHALLEEAGIDYNLQEELIVRREISHEGKNRAYINCHLVPLPFLQKVGVCLIDFIGQHAILDLKNGDFQRSLIDIYGDLSEDLSLFQQANKRENVLFQQCQEIAVREIAREKQEDILRYQLQEIEAESLQIGDDDLLFEKYKRLNSQGEISEKLKESLNRLEGDPSSIQLQLNRLHKLFDSLIKIDPALSETFSLIQQAQVCIQEAHLQIHSYQATLEQEDGHNILNTIENRLSNIARLKKKYGQTLAEIEAFKQKLLSELDAYANLAALSQDTHKALHLSKEETAKAAKQLSSRRKEAARTLEQLLTTHLQSLNMSKAEVHIEILPQNRTRDGDDTVQFWLNANPGEQPALVREHASGGELSRLFLAVKLALADKNRTPTLIFDEIDANVGGKTASIIGEKLAELGKKRQIICITHFPQVAGKAECHFSVQKQEKEGRTITEISLLSKKEREKELLRMLGGEKKFMNISLLLIAFTLCSSFALITDYTFVDKEHWLHFDGEYRNVGKAKLTTDTVKGSHERYADAHAYLYLSHYANENNALSAKVGYSYLKFHWPDNPRFRGDDYNFGVASLGWITTSIKNWRWIVSAATSVDAEDFDFGQSGVYYGVMWGRYNCSPKWGLHIGWYGYTGVKNGYILPILGFDWHPTPSWQINGIFPIDASIRYYFSEHWSLYLQGSAFGRPYRFPIRAHDGVGKFRNGIFEVFSTGVELNLKYQLGNAFSFIAGGGWNFGGWILIKDHSNHHGKYFNFDGAPYAQGKLAFSF